MLIQPNAFKETLSVSFTPLDSVEDQLTVARVEDPVPLIIEGSKGDSDAQAHAIIKDVIVVVVKIPDSR